MTMLQRGKQMTEHTPGPWKVDDHVTGGVQTGRYTVILDGVDEDGRERMHRCSEGKWWTERVCQVEAVDAGEANAALIARAPELLAENEVLKARIAELEAERKWQPIETAPKDGTGIIGMSIQGEKKTVCWIADGYMDGDRWVFASFDLDEDEYTNPTHWMPLPKMTTPETLSG